MRTRNVLLAVLAVIIVAFAVTQIVNTENVNAADQAAVVKIENGKTFGITSVGELGLVANSAIQNLIPLTNVTNEPIVSSNAQEFVQKVTQTGFTGALPTIDEVAVAYIIPQEEIAQFMENRIEQTYITTVNNSAGHTAYVSLIKGDETALIVFTRQLVTGETVTQIGTVSNGKMVFAEATVQKVIKTVNGTVNAPTPVEERVNVNSG